MAIQPPPVLDYATSNERRKAYLEAIARLEGEASARMLVAYQDALDKILNDLEGVVARIDTALAQGQSPMGAMTMAANLDEQRRFVEAQMRRFADSLGVTLADTRKAAYDLGTRHGVEQVRGIASSVFSPSRRTIEQVAARTATGTVLNEHVMMMGRMIGDNVVQGLVEGAMRGRNTRDTARRIQRGLEQKVPHLNTIVRTETLGAARMGVIDSYRDSTVVQGWIWVADEGPNTCEVCWAMNGSEHSLDEEQDSHPNCRCTSTPWITDDPEGEAPQPFSGDEAFRRQPESVQRKVLGPSKYEAYRDGKIPSLSDLVARTDHRRWGPGLRKRTLRELGLPRSTSATRKAAAASAAGRAAAKARRVEAARLARIRRAEELRAANEAKRAAIAAEQARAAALKAELAAEQAKAEAKRAAEAKASAASPEARMAEIDARLAEIARGGFPEGNLLVEAQALEDERHALYVAAEAARAKAAARSIPTGLTPEAELVAIDARLAELHTKIGNASASRYEIDEITELRKRRGEVDALIIHPPLAPRATIGAINTTEPARISTTLDAISGVHTIPGDARWHVTPEHRGGSRVARGDIQVHEVSQQGYLGAYRGYSNGDAVDIHMKKHEGRTGANAYEAVFAHEYGHFLDSSILYDKRLGLTFHESVEGKKILSAYRKSVTFKTRIPKSSKYMRSGDEIFARAYYQYIAVKSGDPVLMAALREEQGASAWQTAWVLPDDEFAPVMRAFDDAFKTRGMLL